MSSAPLRLAAAPPHPRSLRSLDLSPPGRGEEERIPNPSLRGAKRRSNPGVGAPAPGLLRFARNDAFSRRLAPELCHGTTALPPNKKGRRSAERRTVEIRTGTSDESIRTRGQCGERHECFALPRTFACGRPRLSALRRGTRQALRLAQLRAALTGVCSGLHRHNPFY